MDKNWDVVIAETLMRIETNVDKKFDYIDSELEQIQILLEKLVNKSVKKYKRK